MNSEEKISVNVYPDSFGRHLMQVYTGLYELDASGKVNLKFINVRDERLGRPTNHSLFVVVSPPSSNRRCYINFDMNDSMEIDSHDKLQSCDIYFKRSYFQPFIETLPNGLASKIYPFGYNYACSSHNEKSHVVNQLVSHHCITGKFKTTPVGAMGKILNHSLSVLLLRRRRFPIFQEFESSPDNPGNGKILFQTRAWDPQDSPENYRRDPERHRMLNAKRADTVRALRSAFGDVFMGGLERTTFAAQNYSDCLTDLDTEKEEYLELVKHCSIAVTTTGLHDSTGWKLPEFVAASRCVVTEPLKYLAPDPLVEHRNFLTFTTAEECVNACKRLLTDQQLAKQMRECNFSFYQKALSPPALIWKRLKFALEIQDAKSVGENI